jgi:DNA phosphorothioation-associated DGQHR protein 1
MRTNTNHQALARPAIRIDQPLGTFYAFSLNADLLNRLTYSQPAEVKARMEQESDDHSGGYSIFGTQRGESKKRLDEIASFIQTSEATFPNAIILAANYDKDGRYIDDDSRRWTIEGDKDHCYSLRIPSLDTPSASIIDGQHRLHGFNKLPADAPHRNMELLCVVFLELPTPFHAYVFATINFNQKKVDRSLAYELFGFDVDERPAQFWSPETLAVYLSRLLNTDKKSPLYRCVFPAAESDQLFTELDESASIEIRISMATVVDGILRLLSQNPMEDRYAIRKKENHAKGRQTLAPISSIPLRKFYLEGNDKGIYDLISNYFAAVRKTVWAGAGEGSYLFKTVGIQALFDVLRTLVATLPINSSNYSLEALTARLQPCSGLDPNGEKYQASGIGRSAIRQELLTALDM